jgi:serine/threonine-protein kinase
VLERKLGLGGMAEVWLAHPTSPRVSYARVVLKRIHSHLADDKKLVDAFLEEGRLAQLLDHPNIVHVVDVGQAEGVWYIAMEYVDGIDLRGAIVAHEGPLLPSLAMSLVADACAGLHYAHTLKSAERRPLKIVHRDVAPDNLMVDRSGVVRLCDFGIARAETTEATTRTGLRKGKVRYMAPEYLRDHHADPCTDVYSMGATLFELVTGQKPFGHLRSTAAVFDAIVKHGLPRADTVRPSLPPELVEIIAAATDLKPSRRLQTARGFEDLLRMYLKAFPAPTRAEVGAEASLWKQKLAIGPLRPPTREAGSFGQLESTEMIRSVLTAPPKPKAGGGKNVSVAHALDNTQFEIRASDYLGLDEVTDREVAVPEGFGSVVLDAELEAVSQRSAPKKAKKKKKQSS